MMDDIVKCQWSSDNDFINEPLVLVLFLIKKKILPKAHLSENAETIQAVCKITVRDKKFLIFFLWSELKTKYKSLIEFETIFL